MLTRGGVLRRPPVSCSDVLSLLPRGFVHAVFLLLPADQRLRCIEVNRAWRALLADTSFWTQSLDLSRASGVARFSEALFCAAVAKAGGQLRVLDLSGREVLDELEELEDEFLPLPPRYPESLSLATIHAALEANASSLVELHALRLPRLLLPDMEQNAAHVRTLLAAAPSLRLLATSVQCNLATARSMLRSEAPFGARLRLQRLWVNDAGGLEDAAGVAQFCVELRSHTSFQVLSLWSAPLASAAAMDAVANAAIALRLRTLRLIYCKAQLAGVAALVRLIAPLPSFIKPSTCIADTPHAFTFLSDTAHCRRVSQEAGGQQQRQVHEHRTSAF